MSSQLRRFRTLLEPCLGILYFAGWLAANSAEIVTYVPLRTDTFITNPYMVMIAIGFALAIALSRISPVASFSIAGALLLAQLLFWPARFSQSSWDAYLALPVLGLVVGAHASRTIRWIGLALSIVYAITISALLNVPALSLSGKFGLINGKFPGAADIYKGFFVWAVVGSGLAVGAWFIGSKTRLTIANANSADRSERADESREGNATIESLSRRETQIFLLAAEGLSNKAIADRASIEESTVKTHLNSISAKLGLTSRTQLIAYAYRAGILQPTPAGRRQRERLSLAFVTKQHP
jgi:DNA-binding CsgD family transcriptional regulator